VATRLAAGEVEIHGWVYDIGTGTIWQANQAGEFEVFSPQ
jgi:carbonic anhydrase